MDSFEFENGEVLTDVEVEYMTFGTPIYDDDAQIKNAIIYCHGSLGNYASMKKVAPLVGEGDAFDESKYFFISLTALGSPNSCSPSTTDLKNKFPKYFIITGVSSYKVAGHDFILSKFVDEIITSDPDYAKGELTYSLIRTLRLANLAEFNFGLSKEALREMSNNELAYEFESFGNEMIEVDIYDLKYCNESCMYYDVESDLDKVKSKVLIISCKQDPHFPTDLDGIPMSEMIEGSRLIVMDSKLGHLCFNELETISDELKEFMGEFDDC